MVDPNDDMGLAKRPFKVVACIPVLGRAPLVQQTIRRLYGKNGVYKVICAGHEHELKEICQAAGALWVQHENKPLGKKWNAAFMAARDYNPDACLYVGSSDWVSDNWIYTLAPYMEDYDMVGVPGMHLIDLGETNRLCFWPGYHNQRKGESIGIGRMISRRLLDRMHFKPFNPLLDNSLDRSMQVTSSLHAGRIHMVASEKIKCLSISTPLWDNKHKFDDHWNNVLPSEKIENADNWAQNNFPEVKTLCESLKATSPKV